MELLVDIVHGGVVGVAGVGVVVLGVTSKIGREVHPDSFAEFVEPLLRDRERLGAYWFLIRPLGGSLVLR